MAMVSWHTSPLRRLNTQPLARASAEEVRRFMRRIEYWIASELWTGGKLGDKCFLVCNQIEEK